MKTGLTKRQKDTVICFNEESDIIDVRTHNTDLRNRHLEFSEQYPDCCKLTDDDEHGYRIGEHREDIVDWNKRENAEIWRHAWEEKVNEYLEKNNRPERIDMRSYERQGIDLVPTVHLGPAASEMERRGEETILGTLNRDIVKFNSVRKHLRKALAELIEWIEEIKKILSELKEEEKEPTIADILIDYLNFRQEAHRGKSRYFYNKYFG